MIKLCRIVFTFLLFFTVSGFSYATPFSEIKNKMEDLYIEKEGFFISDIDYSELLKIFNAYEYSFKKVRDSRLAPRIFVKSIPDDSHKIKDVKTKKQLFIKMMLTIALKVDEEIELERKDFLSIYEKIEKEEPLSKEDKIKIDGFAKKYRTKSKFSDDRKYPVLVKSLFNKIDILPPSMVIAQAIEESGWGTSRFARLGNALFGEWSWDGTGMIPRGREKGEIYRVKTFKTTLDSVRSYMRNINSHKNYYQLRIKRKEARYRNMVFSGYDFAGALHGYSQKGSDYVDSIRKIIKRNNLSDFDYVKLEK